MTPARLSALFRSSAAAPLARRSLLEAAGVLLVCALLALGLDRSGALRRADGLVYDAFMAVQARPAPDDRLVVVAIDNPSLETLGRWPWSRETHARLIDSLTQAGAAAVALDLLLVEPTAADPVLAASMDRSGRVCLPVAVQPTGVDGAAWGEQAPQPVLAAAAAGLGQVNLSPDQDGVVRRLPLELRAGERRWPHLVSCALEVAGLRPARPPAAGFHQGAAVQARPIGLSFPSGQGAFRTISYADVLNGETPPALLAGRVVLVGMTADGQGDRYAVPVPRGVLMPGVEIQAALADTLLSGRDIRPAPGWLSPTAVVLTLFFLLLAFLVLSPRWGLAAAAVLITAVFAGSAGLFSLGLWASPLAAATALALACPLWSWRRLAATSGYLDAELRRFVQDTEASTMAASDRREPFIREDVVGRQVQAMRQAVDRLRGRNRFVSDTLESLPDAAAVIDADGAVLYANQRARALFQREALEGASIRSELSRLHPGLAAALDLGGEATLDDGRGLRLDAAPLADGADARRIVRLADVTALRAAERQREQALQLLGHDMRAPQTAILSLIGDPATATPDADTRLLGRIADNARRTLKLADDYVRLARAEAGPLTLEPLGFSDLAVEAADILWPTARARDVRIEIIERPEIEIDADRGLITRALMNLLDNAVKHSPEGGVVQVRFTTDDDRVAATVSDAGPGLDQTTFDRLVRPFQHGSDDRAGAGLGLAFIDQVARRLGGRLTLGPAAPGATFILEIPLSGEGLAAN